MNGRQADSGNAGLKHLAFRIATFRPNDYSKAIIFNEPEGNDKMLSTRPYLSLIQQAAQAAGIAVEPIDPDILYRLTCGETSWVMYGVDPGLNDCTSFQLAKHKSAAYAVLASSGVPAVPHHFVANPAYRRNGDGGIGTALKWLKHYGNPLVVKPDDGSKGRQVSRVQDADELRLALDQLFARFQHAAVSPFRQAEREYRVVVLDGMPKLMFSKLRADGEWRHNLALGARPGNVDPGLAPLLADLAVKAAAALGLSFCTVDILEICGAETGAQALEVLEVNGTVHLSEYMKHSDAARDAVYRLFLDVFRSKLNRLRPSAVQQATS